MKPVPFSYHKPKTLEEALDLLGRLDNARVIAGGQSLVPMLNLRVATPDHLIDLGGLPDLVGIEDVGDSLRIGAMTPQRMIEKSDLVRSRCPLLIDALYFVGHQQTRNRGTIGGSLCHLDPAAELPVAAMALDATLTIARPGGTRALPFSEFPAGYLTTALEPGEILIRIDLPVLPPRTGVAFDEFARRHGDFAIVSVAAIVAPDRVTLAIGGIGASPLRLDAASVDEAVALAAACDAEGDGEYPPEYRRHLAGVLAKRALAKAYERSRNG